MNITTQGYNVPKISFGTSITPSISTVIGTKDEFQQLYNMCEASGIAIVDAIISNNRMQGAMFGHCDGVGIELATVTNQYNVSQFVSAHVELNEDDECVVTVTIIPLS